MRTTRIVRMLVVVSAIAVASAAVVIVDAPAASAHDQLLASTPSAGTAMEAGPQEVTLDFSDDVLTVGAVVLVVDAADKNWVLGDVVFDGGRVSAVVDDGMPQGAYEIKWQVVSSDGHPISGLIPFTIGDAQAAPTSSEEQSAEPDPSATSVAADADADASTETSDPDGLPRLTLIGTIGAAIAVGLFVLILFLGRRAKRPAASNSGRPE